jgi:hypothetical protein
MKALCSQLRVFARWKVIQRDDIVALNYIHSVERKERRPTHNGYIGLITDRLLTGCVLLFQDDSRLKVKELVFLIKGCNRASIHRAATFQRSVIESQDSQLGGK